MEHFSKKVLKCVPFGAIIIKRNPNGTQMEVDITKLDKEKFMLERARACMGQADFEKAGIPKGTLCRAMSGKGLKPETIGKIARALGVDVTEILEG